MRNLLFIKAGVYYVPSSIPSRTKFELLSAHCTGDILAIVTEPTLVHTRIGAFGFKGVFLPRWLWSIAVLRSVAYLLTVTATVASRRLRTGRAYDLIIATEPLVNGFLALVLGRLTGSKVLVEVNGLFQHSLRFADRNVSPMSRLKQQYARVALPFVLQRVDAVKLLYPEQLDGVVDVASLAAVEVYPDFVPTHAFEPAAADEPPYILIVGYPWYLKGVDLLIQAFLQIAPRFPLLRLKVIGYCDNKAYFEAIADDHPRIELGGPVDYPDVVRLMAGCTVFALPSRTEAMGRVLIEAMASGKPIVASRVDGIPSVIEHEQNGLLFTPGDVDDLALQLRRVLEEPALAQRLATNGLGDAASRFSEETYVKNFVTTVERVCTGAERRER